MHILGTIQLTAHAFNHILHSCAGDLPAGIMVTIWSELVPQLREADLQQIYTSTNEQNASSIG